MPEAPMDLDRDSQAGENEIGSSGQVTAVQSEAVATRVGRAANGKFRPGILAANAAHHAAARLCVDYVHGNRSGMPILREQAWNGEELGRDLFNEALVQNVRT